MGQSPGLRAGVVGWPLKHTASPTIHRYWFEKLGIQGAYDAYPLETDKMESFLEEVRGGMLQGFNVTIPHKEYIYEKLDLVEPKAKRIGAVNTVVRSHGELHGMNTDCVGFIQNLQRCASAWRGDQGSALVLGAGGAARAVISGLLDEGVAEILLVNRTLERAEALAKDFNETKIRPRPWSDGASTLSEAGLLVNTTALGMTGQAPLEISLENARDDLIVADIVYTPLLTPLLQEAGRRQLTTVDGLGMLIEQARPAFAAWFGEEPPFDEGLRDHVIRAQGL